MKIFKYSILLVGILRSVQASLDSTFIKDQVPADQQNINNGTSDKSPAENSTCDNDKPVIIKPCSVDDMACIQAYFKNNSLCLHQSAAPQPYILKHSALDVPSANFSAILNNVELRGFETGRIADLYYNEKTDTLIFEVKIKSLEVDSPKTIISYLREGTEPIDIMDYSYIEFKNIELTLILRYCNDSCLRQSYVYAYLTDADPPYEVGPAIWNNNGRTDIDNSWLCRMGFSAREAMILQAQGYMEGYIWTQICDYKPPSCE